LLASSELQNSEWQEKIEKLSNKYESNELQLQSQIYEMQLRMHSESITSLRSLDGKSSDDLLSRDETIAKLQVELSSKQVAIERLIRDVAHNNNSDFATEIQASTHAESLKDMLQKRISELESERSLLLEQTSAISVEKNTLKNTLQKTLDDLSIMEVQFRDAQHRYSECERRLVQANAAIRVQEESLQTRLTSLETEKQTLSVEYSKLQNQFVALQNTNGELRADWEHMKSLYLGTKLNRDEIYEKLSGCEKDLDSLRKQNYDLEKSAQTLSQSKLAIERSLSEQLSARIQQLETDKRAAEELLKKTVLERRDFEEKLRLVERQLANALSDRRLRDAAYSKLMESHTALEAEASTLREERRALLAERTELQLSRDDLAQQLASSEREISRLNTRLSSVEAMLASVPESSEQVSRALRLAEEKITKYAVEKTELQNKLIFFEGNIKSVIFEKIIYMFMLEQILLTISHHIISFVEAYARSTGLNTTS
jgi:chromosome segregation ATPase